MIYLKRGLCKWHTGDTTQFFSAVQDFTKSINQKPSKEKFGNYITNSYTLLRMGNEYYPSMNGFSLQYNYHIAFYARANIKFLIKDYYGAIVDMKKFHTYERDSTIVSCHVLGTALAVTNQPKLAFKYFQRNISQNYKGTDEQIIGALAQDRLNRGVLLYRMGQKAKACEDFSVASEMGDNDALEYIKKYCNN